MKCFSVAGLWTNRIFYDNFIQNWTEQFSIDSYNNSLSCCKNGSQVLYNSQGAVVRGDSLSLNVLPLSESITISSSISTKRRDILHGSFRVFAKIPQEEGSNFGFFMFSSILQEIDVEVLTFEQVVRTAIQPSQRNYKINSTNSKIISENISNFSEYRFDWNSEKVDFYLNGNFYHSINKSPDEPGRIILTHRSDGNPLWSKGPPLDKSTVEIKYIDFYFNTTFNEDCAGENEPEFRFKTSQIVGTVTGSIAGIIIFLASLYKLYEKYKNSVKKELPQIQEELPQIQEELPQIQLFEVKDSESLYSELHHPNNSIVDRRP